MASAMNLPIADCGLRKSQIANHKSQIANLTADCGVSVPPGFMVPIHVRILEVSPTHEPCVRRGHAVHSSESESAKCKMESAKCKMKQDRVVLHFSFCTHHFALTSEPKQPSPRGQSCPCSPRACSWSQCVVEKPWRLPKGLWLAPQASTAPNPFCS